MEIAQLLNEIIPDLTTIEARDLPGLQDITGPTLLYNITSEEAYDNADSLHRLVLRLVRWEDQPIFLLTPDPSAQWERGNLWLENGKIDNNGLRLDALTLVLKQDSVHIPDTAVLDLASDRPEMTPIEERMAKELDAKELSFTAQALIGRYHVDFLVEENGTQVVVECDGKLYHSSDEAKKTDEERDSYLQSRGYPVLRFTGGEINHSVEHCVEQIVQVLDKSQVKRSQDFPVDANLDDSQRRAVFTDPGQVCVLAPAGSGKTKVLTNRGIHLINEGFREHLVLALAFNKKAREEMQKRLKNMGFSEVKSQIHTFNSYGVQLLRQKPYSLSGSDFAKHEADKRYSETLFEIIQGHFVDERKRKKNFNTYSKEAIRNTKGQMTAPGEFLQPMCRRYIAGGCPEAGDAIWSQIFEEFLQWQKDTDHLTFADQVYLAVRELAGDPTLRRRTQMSIDTLLIDEFQDLDAAQYMLVEILSLGHGNLFVVGDDDQMIYSWRGADIERMRKFLKDPNTTKIPLSTNYRSSQLVVRHAGYLISNNADREVKNVYANKGVPKGQVELFVGKDMAQESSFLVQALKEARADGLQWKDLAVLVRYKELYTPLMRALNRADIPYVCEAKGRLYSTRAARTMAAYFEAVLQWPSPHAWNDILNVPNKYLNYEYVDQINSSTSPIELLQSGKGLNESQKKNVNDFLRNMENLSKYARTAQPSANDLFEAISTTLKVKDSFKQQRTVSENNDTADEGLAIDLIREDAMKFPTPREFLDFCKEQQDREESESGDEKQKDEDANKDAVRVMTIHKAKGMEWRGVVLFHQEWRKPYDLEKLSSDEKKKLEEEERRVVYVGATRAIESLWVTAERKKRSAFVDELFKDPEFEGLNVPHKIQIQKRRLETLRDSIDRLQNEKGEKQIVVDRGQGMEQAHIQHEIDTIEQDMGFIRRLLLRLGFAPFRLKQLRDDLEVVTEAVRAQERMAEIDHEMDAKNATVDEIQETIDRMEREERFRRLLADPEERTQDKDKVPF